ncbi:calcium-binding protein [Jannaschia sp. KMU-145]|uniref:calcium-binding protein n=1 Tax=Jannaschia halovivens TaxID=3388667 RepID=UPI00396B17CF
MGIFAALAVLLFGGLVIGLDDDDDNTAAPPAGPGEGGEGGGEGPPPVIDPGALDAILGDAEANTLDGTPNADFIRGFAGDDVLNGVGGNDFLKGDLGADSLNGGLGDDTLDGGFGADRLAGGSGDDDLDGGFQSDFLNGQRGADELVGGEGADTLLGGIGNDSLNGIEVPEGDGAYANREGGGDSLNGGSGDDDILFGDFDTVTGGTGADAFRTGDYIEADRTGTITDFDPAADTLELSYAPLGAGEAVPAVTTTEVDGNTIVALGGEAIVTLQGVTGFDGSTVSVVEGPAVAPETGGPLPPAIVNPQTLGTAEDDAIEGNNGDNDIFGLEGNDRLTGRAGDDTLTGGTGADTLVGGVGDDVMIGFENVGPDDDAENANLYDLDLNETGDDVGDRMVGFAGDDIFVMGDDDLAAGGPGADTFAAGDWIETGNATTVTDFEAGTDLIKLFHEGGTAPAVTADVVGADVQVSFGDQVVMNVLGTTDTAAVLAAIEVIDGTSAAAMPVVAAFAPPAPVVPMP